MPEFIFHYLFYFFDFKAVIRAHKAVSNNTKDKDDTDKPPNYEKKPEVYLKVNCF